MPKKTTAADPRDTTDLAPPPEPKAEHIQLLPIERIKPSPDNPRHDVSGRLEELTELADSIRAHGILQPIIVINVNGHIGQEKHALGTYQVVMGHRRLAAAQVVGLERVPAIVRDYGKEFQLSAALVENLQRADISPLEEAAGYMDLAEMGLTQRQIATRVGRGQAHISKRMSLLELAPVVREKLDSGGINVQEALEVRSLPVERQADVFGKGFHERDDIERRVATVKANIKEEAREESARGEIKKMGWTEVKLATYEYRPKGVTEVDGYSVAVKLADHKKMPCHRVWIRDGHLNHGCANPASHRKASAGGAGSPQAQERNQAAAESRVRNKEIRASEEARRLAVSETLTSTGRSEATAYILDLCLRLALHPYYGNVDVAVLDAAYLLGLVPSRNLHPSDYKAAQAAMEKYAEDKGAGRALFAIEMARMERLTNDTGKIAGGYLDQTEQVKERLVDFYAALTAYGYQLSEGDRLTRKKLKLPTVNKRGTPIAEGEGQPLVNIVDAIIEQDLDTIADSLFEQVTGDELDAANAGYDQQLSATETCPNCGAELGRGILESYAQANALLGADDGTTCPECPRPTKKSRKQKIADALTDATAGVPADTAVVG